MCAEPCQHDQRLVQAQGEPFAATRYPPVRMANATRWTIVGLLLALVAGLAWLLALGDELPRASAPTPAPAPAVVTTAPEAPSDMLREPATIAPSLADPLADGTTTAAPRATVRFTGRCLAAESGAPLAGCELKTEDEGPTVARSGPDGTFDVTAEVDARGGAFLGIAANGRVPRHSSFDRLHVGAVEALGDVRLQRGYVVTGRVVDTAGNGVTGIHVVVFGVDTGLSAGQFGQSVAGAVCAADGTFTFDLLLPPGDWRAQLLGTRRQRGSGAFHVETDTGCAPLVLIVEDQHDIAGVVVDDRGEPMPKVGLQTEQGEARAESSLNGVFRLVAPRAIEGSTRVVLTEPDSWSPAFVAPTAFWGQQDVRIVMPRGPDVTIEVADDRGRVVTDFGVLFLPLARTSFPISRDHGTHADGKLTVPTYRVGRHVLRVLPKAQDLLASEPQFVEVGSAAVPVQKVVLERLRRVGVEVVGADGAPIGAAKVSLVRRGDRGLGPEGAQDPHRHLMWSGGRRGNELVSDTTTGADGIGALFAPAVTNGFLLRVRADGCEPTFVPDPVFEASAPLRLVLARGGALAGRVALHGQSRELFAIEVRDAAGNPLALDAQAQLLGPDGVFAVPLLPAGDCHVTVLRKITASSPGSATSPFVPFGAPVVPVHVVGGVTTQVELDAPVQALGSLQGRIRGAETLGKQSQLLLFLIGHVNAARGLFAVAADGSFTADQLPPGRYVVGLVAEPHTAFTATPMLFATEVVITAGGSHTQEFALARRRLTVTLRTPTGEPNAEALELRCGPVVRQVGERAELVLDPAPELPLEFRRIGGEWSPGVVMPQDRREHTVEVVVPEPR